MIGGTPPHAILLTAWLTDLDIPAMDALQTLAGQDAAKGARLLLCRRYARRMRLGERQIAGENARRLAFARWQAVRGAMHEW